MKSRSSTDLSFLAVVMFPFFGLACGGSAPPTAKPSVVVLAVKGKKAKRFRGDLVDVVKSGSYPLIKRSKYDKTAKRLDAEKIGSRNVRKVSKKIGANAVVTSRLSKKGKRYLLRVTVRDGKSGKRVERFELKLKKRKLTKKDRGRLEGQLLAALGQIAPPAEAADERKSDKGKKVADSSSKKKKKKSKKQRRAEERRLARKEKEERELAEKKERKLAKKREREQEAEERDAKAKKREAKAKKREAKAQERKDRKARKAQQAKERKLAAKRAEREKKERAEKAARDKKRRAKEAAERKAELARKKKERAEKRRKKEAKKVEKVVKPKTRDDGQVIDDESPL